MNIGAKSGMQNERGFFASEPGEIALGKFTSGRHRPAPRIRVNAILPGGIETQALR